MSFFGGAETLPKALPFAVGKLSPLGFLRLFRRGRTMATLALMEMVRAATNSTWLLPRQSAV